MKDKIKDRYWDFKQKRWRYYEDERKDEIR